MRIGNREFDTKHHTYVMGILNVTPDSFSDGGKWENKDQMKAHIEEMIEAGVDIIDVGGESTRPGYTFVSVEEEIARVTPVIELLKKNYQIPVSLDTYKWQVAEAGLQAGADLINDIWGLKYDHGEMAGVIAKHQASCCLMHNRREAVYEDYLTEVLTDLEETIRLGRNAGIRETHMMLDPGVGFAKTYEQNLLVLKHLDLFQKFQLPLLLGTSRKSVIGKALDVTVDQRLEGTIATTVLAAEHHWGFVRVHDVLENKRAIQMVEAIGNAEIGRSLFDGSN